MHYRDESSMLTNAFRLVFYQPMTALLTIFLHIVFHPTEKSAAHDLALMEVAVGFFGRSEYITSGEAGFIQVTEFVRQARAVVSKTTQLLCNCIPEDLQVSEQPIHPPNVHVGDTDVIHGNGEPVLEQVKAHESAIAAELSENANEETSDELLSTNIPSDSPDIDLGEFREDVPLSTAAEGTCVDTAGVDLLDLSATGYEPWLNSWLSPSELDLSSMNWVALTQPRAEMTVSLG